MKPLWRSLDASRAPWLSAVRDERGSILALTLMMVAVLSVMVFGLLALGGTESQIAANFLRGAEALSLAEAGAERAIAQFVANPSPVNAACTPACPNPVVPVSLFGGAQTLGALGTYTVTYRPIAFATVLVQSTGQTQLGGVQKIVEVIVTTQFNAQYALLSGQVEAPGFVRGRLGAIHGNKQTQIATTSHIDQTATSSGQCERCTDPTLVGNPAGSGPNKPQVPIPGINPLDLLAKADYVFGDGKIVVNTPYGPILVPDNQILIVATGKLIDEKTGSFQGFQTKVDCSTGVVVIDKWQFCGGTPPNGTYFAPEQIEIKGDIGSPSSPWRATLIAGMSNEKGRVEIHGNVNIVPALQDLLTVAGEVEVETRGGDATLTGVIWSGRTLPPSKGLGQVEIHPRVTLYGNVMAGAQIELHQGATVIYNTATRTGALGALRVVSWTAR